MFSPVIGNLNPSGVLSTILERWYICGLAMVVIVTDEVYLVK